MPMTHDVEIRLRRPNNFDRAVHRLLGYFSVDVPLREDEIYNKLQLDAATLPLMGNTVHQFIENLEHSQLLRRQGGGFVLTPKGESTKLQLAKFVHH